MQRIGDVSLPASASADGPQSDTGWPEWLDALWVRFADMYGETFVRQHGEQPNRTWALYLGGLQPYQVQRGLRRLSERGGDFPPSLPEFKRLCLEPEPPRPQPFKALPEKPRKSEAGTRAVREFRKKLEEGPISMTPEERRERFDRLMRGEA